MVYLVELHQDEIRRIAMFIWLRALFTKIWRATMINFGFNLALLILNIVRRLTSQNQKLKEPGRLTV